MKCQIGLYSEVDAAVDQFSALVDLECTDSARDLLNSLTPFLKEFHCAHGMDDTQTLAAWLPWHLIEVGRESFDDLSSVGISRQINAHIDFFVKLSPGLKSKYSALTSCSSGTHLLRLKSPVNRSISRPMKSSRTPPAIAASASVICYINTEKGLLGGEAFFRAGRFAC